MNRFKAKFYEVEAAEGLSREERRERLKVYIENVYAVLPTNISRQMPQIREDNITSLNYFPFLSDVISFCIVVKIY